MFRQFGPADLDADPATLVTKLEGVWAGRVHDFTVPTTPGHKPLGHPDHRSDLPPIDPTFPRNPLERHRWDHLIYAYMIENTRVYEIFRRVLHEFLHGEKLGTPTAESQAWLRTTEELFYKDPVPLQITAVTSDIRRDLKATRLGAYWRLFAMELNHGSDDGKPFPFMKADASNGGFVSTFEEFLREVWVAMIHVKASAASNPTNTAKIAELAEKLHDMLRSRRQNGNLAREEFAFVTTMSWFHLTLESDTPIVRALRADATGIEQRLFKIAERVGLPAHGLSKHFFDIAGPLSELLITIETGTYNVPGAVMPLFTEGSAVEPGMRTIVMHWRAIRDTKAWNVTTA